MGEGAALTSGAFSWDSGAKQKGGQNREPGNSLVFSVRALKKGPARVKGHRSNPFGADGRDNIRVLQNGQTNLSEQHFRMKAINVDFGASGIFRGILARAKRARPVRWGKGRS